MCERISILTLHFSEPDSIIWNPGKRNSSTITTIHNLYSNIPTSHLCPSFWLEMGGALCVGIAAWALTMPDWLALTCTAFAWAVTWLLHSPNLVQKSC